MQNSSWTAAQSVDELSMPKRIDLSVSGLRRSERIKALNLAETEAKKQTAHVPFINTATKKLLGLFTILSFVSNVEMPNHQVSPHATYTDRIIKRFEEHSEHYDNTVNELHFFSFLTDASSNECFTFGQAMK